MTKGIDIETGEPQSGLLPCCRHLARQQGQEGFAAQLDGLRENLGPKGRQETLESVIRAGRAEGLQAIILRLESDASAAAIAGHLPAVIELRDGRYGVLVECGEGESGAVLLLPRSGGEMHAERLSFHDLLTMWSGGLLRFERVNTALVCFSLIAREHKIELTSERLLHEYNLGTHRDPRENPAAHGQRHWLEAPSAYTMSWAGSSSQEGLPGHGRHE
jgi:ATP-binding cassette, subfamily B, bacterial HlyB/CyaB